MIYSRYIQKYLQLFESTSISFIVPIYLQLVYLWFYNIFSLNFHIFSLFVIILHFFVEWFVIYIYFSFETKVSSDEINGSKRKRFVTKKIRDYRLRFLCQFVPPFTLNTWRVIKLIITAVHEETFPTFLFPELSGNKTPFQVKKVFLQLRWRFCLYSERASSLY